MNQPPAPPRSALGTVSRLTPRTPPPGPADGTPDRPSVLTELRRRAPGMWGTVRQHPAVQAATARAAGWTGGRGLGASVRTVTRSGGSGLAGPQLAEVVPLPAASERRDHRVGSHEAVVVDLARYRAARRVRGRGTA